MRKYEWWEKFLAGRILRDLAECDTHYDDLEKEHRELEKKHGEVYDRLQDCYEDKLDCNGLVAKLLEDVNYYRTRASQLLSALNDAVVIPDIKEIVDLEEAKIVKPYEMAIYDGFDLRAADLEYYALPLDTWKDVLTPIQAEVKDTLKRWVSEVADCDTWALVMNSFLAIAFRDARFDKQGALNIVWSYTHAYNSFVDVDKKVWIYEPQNNEIVGEFKQTEKPYNSRMVWFPHESLS